MIKIRSNQYRTVDQKLAILTGIVLLLLMLLIVIASSQLFNNLQNDAEDRLSIGIAITISESITRVIFSGKYHTRLLVEDMKTKVKELAYVSVQDKNGKIFAHSDKSLNDLPISQDEKEENLRCITQNKPMVFEKKHRELIINEVIIPFFGGLDNEILGVVRVGVNLSEQRIAQRLNLCKLLLLVVFFTIISVIIIYNLIRYFGKSIRYLASHLQGILDHAPIGIIVCDEKNEITVLSKEANNYFPLAKNTNSLNDLFSSLQAEYPDNHIKELTEKVLVEKNCLDVELDFLSPSKDPKCWQISKFPIDHDSHGNAILICSFIRDISEKRIAETSLKESEETFRRLFALSADPIMIVKDGKFLECNEATLKILGGIPKEKLIGSTPMDISPEFQENGEKSAELSEKLFALALEKGYMRFEWQGIKIDGSPIIVDASMTPVLIKGSTMFHITLRDITAYKHAAAEKDKLQEQLLQSQKMDAIGQLAGGIAHDFNNILAGIIGATELLQMETITPEKRNFYLNIILKSTTKAAELTNKLLTFARKGYKEEKPVDIVQVISDAIGILQRTINKNVTINLENLAQSSMIVGDGTLLQNVFLNMGINASHAMPDGGKLNFKIQNITLEENYCNNNPFEILPGNYVEVEVRDDGCGMSPEIQKRIFEPFFTTKESGKGTGLGLSVAYGTIQTHKGALSVYSEPGNGTVFHVYLPLNSNISLIHSEEDAQIVPGSGKILVIDDEDFIRTTTKNMLESLGYEVFVAENGREALNLLEELNQQIDLIILDMIMPVMSGKETLMQIKETSYKGKIIVSSGFSKDDELSESIKDNICSFIHKPFRFAELSQLIAKIISDGN